MNRIELNGIQREILAVLVEEYRTAESPVKGAEIAEAIGRTAGNVRNQIGSLKALGLVEGIPGPKGGYRPTHEAYDALDSQGLEDPERLIVARDYERVTVTVDEIDLTDVHDPEHCRARLGFDRPVEGFAVGDPIVVGPTPISKLVLVGEIEAIDGDGTDVHLDVGGMEAPFPTE